MSKINTRIRGSIQAAAIPLRALDRAELSALDLRVLGAIAWHARGGAGCFAANATIAERLGCHANSVGRSIARLLDTGMVRDLEGMTGRQRSRRRVLAPVHSEADAGELTELNRSGEFANSPNSPVAGDIRDSSRVSTTNQPLKGWLVVERRNDDADRAWSMVASALQRCLWAKVGALWPSLTTEFRAWLPRCRAERTASRARVDAIVDEHRRAMQEMDRALIEPHRRRMLELMRQHQRNRCNPEYVRLVEWPRVNLLATLPPPPPSDKP